MTNTQRSGATWIRQHAAALCAVGVIGAGVGVAAPAANAQIVPGYCDLTGPNGEKIPRECSEFFSVQYMVQGEKKVPGLVLPGKEYSVKKIPKGFHPEGVTFDSAEYSYEILDNKTRVDFLGRDGSKSKDRRVGADGEVQGEARTSQKGKNEGAPIGEVYIPREARNEIGTHGVKIRVTYIDGSTNEAVVPIEAVDSGAATHEMSMFDTSSGDVEGDKVENAGDEDDRSSVTKINMMVGQQRTLYVRNEQTRDPDCPALDPIASKALESVNTVCDDKNDPPERLYITDEYGQVLDEEGKNSDNASGVNWARLESFQKDGQNSYRMRLYPGKNQLDENGGMKKNTLYITSQYADGSWRTNRLEITVRPHENLPQTLTLPPVSMRPWEVKSVKLQGEMPQGHGKLTFGDSEQNPSWVSINRYSGKVTYKPQKASVAVKTYPIVINVKAESGANMQITSSVQILPQSKVEDFDTSAGSWNDDVGDTYTPPTQPVPEQEEKKGFFGQFWSKLTSLFKD